MSEAETVRGAWIAGLIEHRVALSVAASASILLIALMVMQPGGKPARQADHSQGAQTDTLHPNDSLQATAHGPRYQVPEKPSTRPKPQVIKPAPAIKPITPSTPSEPARIRKQADLAKPPTTTVKPPAPATIRSPKPSAGARISKSAPPTRSSTTTPAQGNKATATIFFVQVAAYRERSSAQQHAARLLQKGWNSTTTANAKGWYTVRIGPVSSRAAADKLRQQLLDKAKLKGFIVQG